MSVMCHPTPQVCCDTLSNTPHPVMVMSRDDPPWETKGSGMPVVGTMDKVTLMCSNAWLTIRQVKPQAK